MRKRSADNAIAPAVSSTARTETRLANTPPGSYDTAAGGEHVQNGGDRGVRFRFAGERADDRHRHHAGGLVLELGGTGDGESAGRQGKTARRGAGAGEHRLRRGRDRRGRL